MSQLKRLPDAELEVMKALWSFGEPVEIGMILSVLAGEKDWTRTTITNMLSRLTKKGFIKTAPKGRAYLYEPAISRDEYLKAESKSILLKLFGGSPKAFMASLLESDSLTDVDIDELEDFIHEAKNGRD